MATVARTKRTARRAPYIRARQACMRCHKQKLRCDNERPCALCTWSSMECKEGPGRTRKRRKSHQVDLSQHASWDRDEPREEHSSIPARVELGSQEEASESASPNDEVFGRNMARLLPLQERTSTYGMVNQLFQNYESTRGPCSDATAIPDGSPGQTPTSSQAGRVLVADLISMQLPSAPITKLLFNNFLASVHWFVLVFHEPTVRAELDTVLMSHSLHPRRLPFLILILVILLFGSKYTDKEVLQTIDPDFDLEHLRFRLLSTIEEKLLDLFEGADVESVQACILLTTFYIYNARPNRAYIVLGAALNGAKALGLYRESKWGQVDIIGREKRRRAWWGLYAADGFAAMCYGRPSTIREDEWDVGMVSNIDDASTTCPGFQSTELLEDGTLTNVTTLSYQRFKYRLYRIASPILGVIYMRKTASIYEVANKVRGINESLLAWKRSLPPELRLESFSSGIAEPTMSVVKIFQLQALTLQLFYDNVQLLLHRPLLAYDASTLLVSSQRLNGSTRNDDLAQDPTSASSSAEMAIQMCQRSRNQCYESAIRTSQVFKHNKILLEARNTTATPFIGIQTFTAGVMLGAFALSMPFTSCAQEAKQGIGRLVKMPKVLGYRAPVTNQCGSIMQELIHLILAEEKKALLSDTGVSVGGRSRDILSQLPCAAENNWSPSCYNTLEDTPSALARSNAHHRESAGLNTRDGSNLVETEVSHHAVTSLQSVFRGRRASIGTQHQSPSPSCLPGQVRDAYDDEVYAQTGSGRPPTESSSQSWLPFDDTSQTWIWDDIFNSGGP